MTGVELPGALVLDANGELTEAGGRIRLQWTFALMRHGYDFATAKAAVDRDWRRLGARYPAPSFRLAPPQTPPTAARRARLERRGRRTHRRRARSPDRPSDDEPEPPDVAEGGTR